MAACPADHPLWPVHLHLIAVRGCCSDRLDVCGNTLTLDMVRCQCSYLARSAAVLEWDAAELEAAIAALPVLDSSSPIRTWQLDDLHGVVDEEACSAASHRVAANF